MKVIRLIVSSFLIFVFSCNEPIPRKPVFISSHQVRKSSIDRNKQLLEREEQLIEQLILKDTLNSYVRSSYGFWYYKSLVNAKPGAQKIKSGETVDFKYRLSDINNELIYDQTWTDIQTTVVDKEKLFTGLRSAIKELSEKERGLFYLPSFLGYGYKGDLDKIGPNEILILELEILKQQSNP